MTTRKLAYQLIGLYAELNIPVENRLTGPHNTLWWDRFNFTGVLRKDAINDITRLKKIKRILKLEEKLKMKPRHATVLLRFSDGYDLDLRRYYKKLQTRMKFRVVNRQLIKKFTVSSKMEDNQNGKNKKARRRCSKILKKTLARKEKLSRKAVIKAAAKEFATKRKLITAIEKKNDARTDGSLYMGNIDESLTIKQLRDVLKSIPAIIKANKAEAKDVAKAAKKAAQVEAKAAKKMQKKADQFIEWCRDNDVPLEDVTRRILAINMAAEV